VLRGPFPSRCLKQSKTFYNLMECESKGVEVPVLCADGVMLAMLDMVGKGHISLVLGNASNGMCNCFCYDP